jgi:folate-binding protein YgfZ
MVSGSRPAGLLRLLLGYNRTLPMSNSTVQEMFTQQGTRLGGYRGAETPAGFGDPASEFRALLSRVGIFDMSWQAKLLISGQDRVRWTNGMVTNNVRDLEPGRGVYCFVLNPQGHNLGDLVVYNRGDYLLATTDRAQVKTITALLKRYIIMDKVEIEDISDKLVSIGIAGPQAVEIWESVGIDVTALEPAQVVDTVWKDIGISVARDAHPQWNGYEVWLAPDNAETLWVALTTAGAEPVGSEALEMYRIARGVPRYGVDLRERDLPQETGQEHALSFVKGCYIGQEIVERIRSRGNVHRQLIGFGVDGEPPQAGTKVRAADKDVGEITGAARVTFPAGSRTLALGYIRREFAAPGTKVQIGDRDATVYELPFQFQD